MTPDLKKVQKALLDVGWIPVDDGTLEIVNEDNSDTNNLYNNRLFGTSFRFKSDGEEIILPLAKLIAIKMKKQT